jgi:hypothetical protein
MQFADTNRQQRLLTVQRTKGGVVMRAMFSFAAWGISAVATGVITGAPCAGAPLMLTSVVVVEAPPVDAPIDPYVIPKTPVGKQLSWVLRSINARKVEETEDRFSKRFLEIFKLSDVVTLLEGLRDRAFDGHEILMVQPDANARQDALTCTIGNEQVEKYLTLFLTVDENTGQIAGLSFSMGLRAAPDDIDNDDQVVMWDDLTGVAGDMERDVWFGLYRVNFSGAKTDLRIKEIYEFGHRRTLNIGTFSRVYSLITFAEDLKQAGEGARGEMMGKAVPGDNINITMRDVVGGALAGSRAATDYVTVAVKRERVDETLRSLQDRAGLSLPYLTFARWEELHTDPDELAAYAAVEERPAHPDAPRVNTLPPAWKAEPEKFGWEVPMHIDRVGWFATPREAAYALAKLADLCREVPEMRAVWSGVPQADLRDRTGGKAGEKADDEPAEGTGAEPFTGLTLVSEPPRFAPEKFKSVLTLTASGVPGVCAIGYVMEHANGSTYVMVMAWNNAEGTLDEPRMHVVMGRGLTILDREIEASAP